MMPSVLPRSLRTVSRTAWATRHAPWPLGWIANLLDPFVGQRPQGRCGIAAPVVDYQCGGGVRPKDGASVR